MGVGLRLMRVKLIINKSGAKINKSGAKVNESEVNN